MSDDTLPQWLHERFGAYLHGGDNLPWDQMEDADRDYWAHEAAAVRRAVARDGFKQEARSALLPRAERCPQCAENPGRDCWRCDYEEAQRTTPA